MPCICAKEGFDTFAAGLFQECVYGAQQSFSFAVGWLATFFFFGCAYPQLRLNILLRKSEGLSVFLLLCWCCNDICNLVSIVLLKQLFTQKLTGSVWAFFDICMMGTHLFFNYQKKFIFQSRNADFSRTEVLIYVMVLSFVALNLVWAGFYNQQLIINHPENYGLCPSQEVVDPGSPAGLAGNIIIYLSIPFNLGSRAPQLFRNWKRKSAEGVSYGLFVCSGTDNFLLFINMVFWNFDQAYQIAKIPYFFSVGGASILDAVVIAQKVYYAKQGMRRISQEESTLGESVSVI